METTAHLPGMAHRLTRWLSVLAAAAVLAALASFAMATQTQAQVAGAIYSGSFQPLADGCGGGTIELHLSDDGSTIFFILVDGALFSNIPINELEILLDPPITIQPDGSFDQTFEQIPGVPIGVSGNFDETSVSGVVDVPTLACSPTFTATTGDAMEEPVEEMTQDDAVDDQDDQLDAMPDSSAPAPEASIAMPVAGTGPTAQSNLWLAAAATMSLLGLTLVRLALARASRD